MTLGFFLYYSCTPTEKKTTDTGMFIGVVHNQIISAMRRIIIKSKKALFGSKRAKQVDEPPPARVVRVEGMTNDTQETELGMIPEGTGMTEREVFDFVFLFAQEISQSAGGAVANAPEWNTFLCNRFCPDFVFVKPCGNTTDLSGFRKVFENPMMVQDYQMSILSVVSIKIVAPTAASVVFRANLEFLDKGEKLEEWATFTIVVVVLDGQLKITIMDRSIGKTT